MAATPYQAIVDGAWRDALACVSPRKATQRKAIQRRSPSATLATLARRRRRPRVLLLRRCEMDYPTQDGWQLGNTVAICVDLPPARLYAVALHEFAHKLGVEHKRCTGRGRSHVMSVVGVGQSTTQLTLSLRKRWCRQLAECG